MGLVVETFQNPPEIKSVNGELHITFSVAAAMFEVDGKTVTSAVYNGKYIPPVLRAPPRRYALPRPRQPPVPSRPTSTTTGSTSRRGSMPTERCPTTSSCTGRSGARLDYRSNSRRSTTPASTGTTPTATNSAEPQVMAGCRRRRHPRACSTRSPTPGCEGEGDALQGHPDHPAGHAAGQHRPSAPRSGR